MVWLFFFPGLGCLSQVLSSSQRFSTSLTHLDLSGNTSSLVTEEATVHSALCVFTWYGLKTNDATNTLTVLAVHVPLTSRSGADYYPDLACNQLHWFAETFQLVVFTRVIITEGPIRCSCNKVFLCTTKIVGLVTCCPSTVKVSEGLPETATLFQDIRWWFSILDKNVDTYRA